MKLDRSARQKTQTYWETVKERNKLLNRQTGERLATVIGSSDPLKENLWVASTGSDGRLEKGFVSKLEVIL